MNLPNHTVDTSPNCDAKPGDTVVVLEHPLEARIHIGCTGTLVGYSTTHGYARIQTKDYDHTILIHPEAVRVVKQD